MQIADKYAPQQIEAKWYEYWIGHKLFHSEPDEREPYTIVIPPPNVTGMLHMGHMLNNTLQDVLVRRARMSGKNACWVPGMDHASIATEAKVVAMLREKGIEKSSLSRDEFLKYAWEWKEKYGGVILQQLRKLGASCDWDRTCFTMDEARTESVLRVFCDLYDKGRIYRGVRMVNWDPAAQTALSDEEVVFKESHGKLYYLRYRVEGADRTIIVATTRPETILGDTALCVNPEDPRYQDLPPDARVIVPLVGRSIPVIRDTYVDIGFGTGALKVTPAHDVNDYMLGEKYGLETIDIFNDDGTINDKVGLYVGHGPFRRPPPDREGPRRRRAAREGRGVHQQRGLLGAHGRRHRAETLDAVVPLDEGAGRTRHEGRHGGRRSASFPKSTRTPTATGWRTSRTGASRASCGGDSASRRGICPRAASSSPRRPKRRSKRPAQRAATRHCSSPTCARTRMCWTPGSRRGCGPSPSSTESATPDNPEIEYYYPTNDLVTAPDIIFFWVARMIMAGYEYRQDKPFASVYFTGIVRDKIGRKMSKQLGNSPDPLDLIAQYGADGVRMAMLISSSAGNDVMFDEALCEQGRNFGNKIWNAFRLVNGWSVDPAAQQCENNRLAVAWFEQALARSLRQIDEDFKTYRISEAFKEVYRLFWDDFSSLYLEMVKPAFGQPVDAATLDATKGYFDALMRMLHPFMPFVTEEIWQALAPRRDGESICVAQMPQPAAEDAALLARFELVKEIVSSVRNIRNQKNLPQKEALALHVIADENYPAEFAPVITKMANLASIESVTEKDPAAAAFLVKTTQYFVPLAGKIDAEAEIKKLTDDLKYYEGFLASVMKKLSNERFVQSAPEKVVANERAKQADAEAKIAALKEQLAALK